MQAYLVRAYQLLNGGRYQEAIQTVQKVLDAHPEDVQAINIIAFCYAGLQQHERSVETAKHALSLEPHNPFCHYTLARVYQAKQEWHTAINHCRESIRLDSENPESFILLAGLQLQIEKSQEALAAAHRALSLDPESVEALSIESLALSRLGKTNEAQLTSSQALSRNPESGIAFLSRGHALLEAGKHKQARECFLESLRYDPIRNEPAQLGLAMCLKYKHLIYKIYFFLTRHIYLRILSPAPTLGLIFVHIFLPFLAVHNIFGRNPLEKADSPILWWGYVSFLTVYLLLLLENLLGNFLIRLDPDGRLALTEGQLIKSLAILPCLILALLPLVAQMLGGQLPGDIAFRCLALLVPITFGLLGLQPKPIIPLLILAAVLFFLGILPMGFYSIERFNAWNARSLIDEALMFGVNRFWYGIAFSPFLFVFSTLTYAGPEPAQTPPMDSD